MAEPNATVNETGRILAIEGYTLLFIEICIIFLNVLAVVVIVRFKRKHNPDILILTLAIADLAKACIPLNMTLVAYLGGLQMKTGSPSCAIFGWTAFTLNSGIMLVMTFMAIDRYVAICWPFKYKEFLSRKRLIYTIVAIFVFSGVHSMLPLVGVGWMKSFNHGTFCHFDFDSTVAASVGYKIFVLVLGISMLIVVIFCYSRAMCSVRALIRRQTRRMSTASREISTSEQKQQAMNHMFARLMLVMMVVFCISWLLFLVVVLQHASGWFSIRPEAHFWSMRLAVANSIFNPIIGAIMCKPYRSGYLFILCKLLHCFGLCSSYQAQDPWAPSRKLSSGSRKSSSFEPPGATAKEKEGGYAGASLNCNFDSGIVSDSPGVFPQSGITNASFEMNMEELDGTIDESVESKTNRRPGLGRKRISFKDEHEAMRMEALSAVEELPTKPDKSGKQVQNVEKECLPQSSNEHLTESARLKIARNEFPEDDSLVERPQQTNSPMFACSAEIIKKYSFGGRQRKHGFQGIHSENAASGMNLVDNYEKHPSPEDNEVSLLRQGTMNLPPPSSYHTQPTSSKLDKESKTLPDERRSQDSRENSNALQGQEIGDCLHDCGVLYREMSPPLVQITDFPVDTNLENTTVIAAKQNVTDSAINQASMSSSTGKDSALHSSEYKARSLETSPCRTLVSEPRTLEEELAYQQSNGGNPMDVSARKQDSPVLKYSDHPTTPKRAHGNGPHFNNQTFEPNEFLLDPFLVSTDHSKPSRRYDLPPFPRQSFSFGTSFVDRLSRWRLSEPDLTRFLPEGRSATAPSQDSTTAFMPARGPRNIASEACREGNENPVLCRPVRTGTRGQQRKSSRIYRALSERSQTELEREVFC